MNECKAVSFSKTSYIMFFLISSKVPSRAPSRAPGRTPG